MRVQPQSLPSRDGAGGHQSPAVLALQGLALQWGCRAGTQAEEARDLSLLPTPPQSEGSQVSLMFLPLGVGQVAPLQRERRQVTEVGEAGQAGQL